jgi:2-dehydropantoate 2-reductase
MRLCVFGAGAIGGYLAAKLATVEDLDLSLVARGPHLSAIGEGGLWLVEGGSESVHNVRASSYPAEWGILDSVLLAL